MSLNGHPFTVEIIPDEERTTRFRWILLQGGQGDYALSRLIRHQTRSRDDLCGRVGEMGGRVAGLMAAVRGAQPIADFLRDR
jgi:hypothetical protein